jgi:hypothetical protein
MYGTGYCIEKGTLYGATSFFSSCFYPFVISRIQEAVFLNFNRAKESIPPAYVAWRAGKTTLFLLGSYPYRLL